MVSFRYERITALNPGYALEAKGVGAFPMYEYEVRQYQPLIEGIYAQASDLYHDIPHVSRGLIWALGLGKEMCVRGIEVDMKVIAHGMVLHDIMAHPTYPYDHAEEGAKRITPFVKTGVSLTSEQADHVIQIVKFHNKLPSSIPEPVWTPEFVSVTGADALDLARIEDGREIWITTAVAWELRYMAVSLYNKSKQYRREAPFDGVMRAAQELGLVVA